MNPLKCTFGIASGKFLMFVVWKEGIEIDSSKIKAIVQMPPSRSFKELRGLQGRLAYIRCFISKFLLGFCQPFKRLLKKDTPFIWNQAYQNAYESIKQYLAKSSVLVALVQGRPLILYITTFEQSLGAMLAQYNDEGRENALYYISQTMVSAKVNYSSIENICLVIVFDVQKLRH